MIVLFKTPIKYQWSILSELIWKYEWTEWDIRNFHISATCLSQFFLLLQRQINGPIDEYSFQEKAPNSYDLRDH